MENSNLNLAHFHSRKADNHVRHRRFDDAIESHQQSANYLDEALKSTTTQISIESLQLQKHYHLKQKDLIKIKKLQYEKYKLAIDQQLNLKTASGANVDRNTVKVVDKSNISKTKTESSCQLQLAIYKTMEEADSLLEMLGRKGSDSDSLKSLESDLDDIKLSGRDESNVTCSNKKSSNKDETNIIEELRSLNHQLHIMVFQLVTQLDESIQEADTLRDKVSEFEKEKRDQLGLANLGLTLKERYDRRSPDVVEAHEEFPALAPLELPNFDYESFATNKSLDDHLNK